jgi:8-oxo-dGTP pyrophosphatase MutT (NUDIX family)
MVPTLSTVPNAGLPQGFRKLVRPKGDEKFSAAGLMFVAPDGRMLFAKRSGANGADHEGEWAFPAGRVEQDEEPADAARREALEEVGHLASWDLAPVHRETRDGVDFATFGQPVPECFEPILSDEFSEHVWADPKEAPQPLHPGVAALLAKFFEEEAEEPEHEESGAAKELERDFEGEDDTGAIERETSGIPPKSGAQDIATDSALRLPLALDRESVRKFDSVGRMRVSVANISKSNICPYAGREIPGWDEETQTHALGLDPDKIYMMLRDPEELRKSVPTWNGVQLLRKHVPVDVDDHKKYDIVGTVGTNAAFNDPYLQNSLVFWTKEGIDLVESEEQRELSSGYEYDPIMKPGVFKGEPYDGVMTNIRGNHVALVEEGRVGPDVMVEDSIVNIQWAMIENALGELGINA